MGRGKHPPPPRYKRSRDGAVEAWLSTAFARLQEDNARAAGETFGRTPREQLAGLLDRFVYRELDRLDNWQAGILRESLVRLIAWATSFRWTVPPTSEKDTTTISGRQNRHLIPQLNAAGRRFLDAPRPSRRRRFAERTVDVSPYHVSDAERADMVAAQRAIVRALNMLCAQRQAIPGSSSAYRPTSPGAL